VRHRTYLLEVFFEANDFAVLRGLLEDRDIPFRVLPSRIGAF
jgi:hypothetical protein